MNTAQPKVKGNPEPPRSNFVITDTGEPHFQVDMGDGVYRYAHVISDSVQFRDGVGDYEPQPLPRPHGKPLRFILMPSGGICECRPLSGDALFRKVKRHLRRYVDLAELDFDLCAFYIIFTWFSPKVETLGYLRLLGDTGKGKSRALKAVGDLCFYSIIASGASSFSGIARTKEKFHGTLIIDEADLAGDASSQMIKYLNLGFEKGKIFILSDKKNPKNQDYFDPFCPKVIAMRQPFKDNATEGRLLSISMRETTNKAIPIILDQKYEAETQELRNELARFTLEHWYDVDGSMMLDLTEINVEPRLKQLAMPLSIIFQLWPEGRERFIEYLLRRQEEIRKIRATSWDGTLVNTVIQLAKGELELLNEFEQYQLNGLPAAITPSMVSKAAGCSAKSATERLNGCGFELEIKRSVVGDGTKTKTTRAYSVPDNRTWLEIIQRYYVNHDDPMPEPPECLKSLHYVTDVTDVTDFEQETTPTKEVGVLSSPRSVTTVTSVTTNEAEFDDYSSQPLLGLTPEQVIEIWEAEDKPVVPISQCEVCYDLSRTLTDDTPSRHLDAITQWISTTLEDRKGVTKQSNNSER